MFRSNKMQAALLVAVGALLGYLAASGNWRLDWQAEAAAPRSQPANNHQSEPVAPPSGGASCCDGLDRTNLVAQAGPSTQALHALAAHNQQVAAAAQKDGKKPNIVIIWGDDIGQSNISA